MLLVMNSNKNNSGMFGGAGGGGGNNQSNNNHNSNNSGLPFGSNSQLTLQQQQQILLHHHQLQQQQRQQAAQTSGNLMSTSMATSNTSNQQQAQQHQQQRLQSSTTSTPVASFLRGARGNTGAATNNVSSSHGVGSPPAMTQMQSQQHMLGHPSGTNDDLLRALFLNSSGGGVAQQQARRGSFGLGTTASTGFRPPPSAGQQQHQLDLSRLSLAQLQQLSLQLQQNNNVHVNQAPGGGMSSAMSSGFGATMNMDPRLSMHTGLMNVASNSGLNRNMTVGGSQNSAFRDNKNNSESKPSAVPGAANANVSASNSNNNNMTLANNNISMLANALSERSAGNNSSAAAAAASAPTPSAAASSNNPQLTSVIAPIHHNHPKNQQPDTTSAVLLQSYLDQKIHPSRFDFDETALRRSLGLGGGGGPIPPQFHNSHLLREHLLGSTAAPSPQSSFRMPPGGLGMTAAPYNIGSAANSNNMNLPTNAAQFSGNLGASAGIVTSSSSILPREPSSAASAAAANLVVAPAPPTAENRRMRGGVIEPFPEKLHRLLLEVEVAGRSDVISFIANGRAFAIHKPDRFFKDIVPLYFRQSRLSSFKRQLNLYGFELINTGPARGGYYHELFVKDRPDLCRRMRRVAVKVLSNDKKKGSSSDADEDEKEMKKKIKSEDEDEIEEDEDDDNQDKNINRSSSPSPKGGKGTKA